MDTRSINGGKWFVFYKDQVLVKSKDPLILPSSEDEPLFVKKMENTGSLPITRGGIDGGNILGISHPSDLRPWG